MHVIAAKAVAFYEAQQPEFKQYAQRVVGNADALAFEMKKLGFNLVTGGTSNHLILSDVHKSFGVDGKVVEKALDRVGLTLNANSVADDPLPPFRPSGIRLGTPALTTRGLELGHMSKVAQWMLLAIESRDIDQSLLEIRDEIKSFMLSFPLPNDR